MACFFLPWEHLYLLICVINILQHWCCIRTMAQCPFPIDIGMLESEPHSWHMESDGRHETVHSRPGVTKTTANLMIPSGNHGFWLPLQWIHLAPSPERVIGITNIYIYEKIYGGEIAAMAASFQKVCLSDFGIGNGPKPLIPWQVNDSIKASYPAW